MNDSRVRGDTQGQRDDPSIPPLEQAGVNDNEDIEGSKKTADSTGDDDEH